MGRLIDEEKLMELVIESKKENKHKDFKIKVNHDTEHEHFLYMICEQPTAYDQEKVVQQLEEMKPDIECFDNEEDYEYARNRHHKYVQIVRNGGVK